MSKMWFVVGFLLIVCVALSIFSLNKIKEVKELKMQLERKTMEATEWCELFYAELEMGGKIDFEGYNARKVIGRIC